MDKREKIVWAFQIERTGRLLAREWLGTQLAADRNAQRLANEYGEAVGFIRASKLAGWTGHHSEEAPQSDFVVEPDDMTPAGLEEPGE